MSKKQEVVSSTTSEVSIPTVEAWGSNEMSSNDFVISKILAMQGLSKFVMDGKAMFGDFCDSITGDKLGGLAKPLAFIPFHMEKTWVVSKLVNGKYKFSHIDKVTPSTENLPWEFEMHGEKYSRQYQYNFYVLLEENPIMPYMVSFKSMSLRAGKKLATRMFVLNKQLGKSPAAFIMSLVGRKESNDKGTFVVMDVDFKGPSKAEDQQAAFDWFKTITTNEIKVDNSEFTDNGPETINVAGMASDNLPF